MPPATVWFSDLRARVGHGLLEKTRQLVERSGFLGRLSPGDKVAIKLHFGEAGNTGFLSPVFARTLVEEITKAGARPYLVDTNTLYKGSRSNAIDHLETALRNGFSYATVGAPLLIGDGLIGLDYVRQSVKGVHFSEVKVASGIYHADALVTLAHFTGHELFGYGAVIKSLGMGGAPPSGKQELHSDVKPVVAAEKCTSCGLCVRWCPADAIAWKKKEPAVIDLDRCIGCGECTAVCRHGAIAVNWKTDLALIQEKTAEYALGVLANKKDKALHLSFLMGMSPECDCYDYSDTAFAADTGILASFDPVAVDYAGAVLVNQAQGLRHSKLEDRSVPDKLATVTGVDWSPLIRHAEAIGLGNREHLLEKVG